MSTLRIYNTKTFSRDQIVVFKYKIDSAYWKHEHWRAVERIREALQTQPYWDWLVENKIEMDLSSFNDVSTFQEVVLVTAKMTEKEKTFFLLKYSDVVNTILERQIY